PLPDWGAGGRSRGGPAEPSDLIADLVPPLEIATRPRLAARGEQLLDFRRRAVRRRAASEEPEHARELHQLIHAGDESRAGAAPVAGFGQRPAEVEENAQRLRRVEVVVHRPLEARPELGEGRRQGSRRAAVAHRGRVVNQARQALERSLALLHALLGPLDHVPVVSPEHPEPERVGAVALDDSVDVQRVAERLRHLLLAHVDHAVVHPVARKRLARAGFGLGDLALVVGKDEIFAAAVNVERRAEVFHRHRGALDVPARPAGPPRALPRGLPGLGGLPEREVAGIALALVHLDAGPREQIVEVLAREPSVGWKASDRELDIALDRMGVARAAQAARW